MFSYLLYEEQLEKAPNDPPIRLSTIMKNHGGGRLLKLFYLT
jgi:hypothetical protein